MTTKIIGSKQSKFKIEAMDCPTEEAMIQGKLGNMAGIDSLEFNLIQRVLTVNHTLRNTNPIETAIQSLGFEPIALDASSNITGNRVTRLRIEAMDCPTEESMIRGKLEGMSGISRLSFNLIERVLTVNHSLKSEDPLYTAIKSLGMEAVAEKSEETPAKKEKNQNKLFHWLPFILAVMAAAGSELFEVFEVLTPWLPAAMAFLAVGLSGLTTYKKGWIALINRNLNINALMSIAVTGALILRLWPEAAMVMVLFALAEKIEALSLDRARNAIQSLMKLSPDQAAVQQADGSWKMISAESVEVGASVRVRPGERLSHDGIITLGTTSIDQSPITGESLPVEKSLGDQVFAGTVNQQGEIVFRVSSEAKASTLSRIIHLVEEAQANRSSTQRFVDRFAQIYTPLVFIFAILMAVIPPMFLGGAWFDWIYKALVILVIACPCALVISTPVTIVSALANAARMGIIVKGGAYIELARQIDYLAFDKTGTITYGKPAQTDFLLLEKSSLDLSQIAFSLAVRSDHPVSHAIAIKGQESNIEALECSSFNALPGRGIKAEINGETWYLGNHRLIEELGICSSILEKKLEILENQGKTAVVLATETQTMALFGVADTIKETSRTAIAELHKLGIKTLMLSGDNPKTAEVISKQVYIDEVRGNQLPQDKADVILALSQKGIKVGMVGDGINDAPALARAHIGIAMGLGGTDTAIETADVVLMDDDLRKVPQLVKLSRRTVSVLTQNITIALGIKAVFLVLTLLGLGTIWMAVFADMGASLIVVFNGLRLTRKSNK